MRAALAALLCAGCNQILGISDVTFGGDDEIDARPAGSCADWTYEPTHGIACQEPTGEVVEITGASTYDTSAGVLNPGAITIGTIHGQFEDTPVMLLVLDRFSVEAGATLTVRGDLPLMIYVHGDTVIDGLIDVSATMGPDSGPGGGSTCVGSAAEDDPGGAGGGAGGSFGVVGGDGGAGMVGMGGGADGEYDAFAGPLIGGCSGGAGGLGTGGIATFGGGGGGGLQISARDAVLLGPDGAIQAGGSGGGGGCDAGGGGGGGSGGLIWLEATELEVEGSLCANGGSGGEGAVQSNCGAGGRVAACTPTGVMTDNVPTGGGVGGGGGARDDAAEAGGDPLTDPIGAAGGGGGGGVGIIMLRGEQTAAPALTSPTPLELDLE